MFKIATSSTKGFCTVLDGIERKTLVYEANTFMFKFRLKKGTLLPIHKHPHEQTGYLVKGHIILLTDGQTYDIKPTESWSIPGNVEHRAIVLESSFASKVFPIREDYIP